MKILYFQWLTRGDILCNKAVQITDEDFEALKRCRGFPHQIDPNGGQGHEPIPNSVLNRLLRLPSTTKGPIDAVMHIY